MLSILSGDTHFDIRSCFTSSKDCSVCVFCSARCCASYIFHPRFWSQVTVFSTSPGHFGRFAAISYGVCIGCQNPAMLVLVCQDKNGDVILSNNFSAIII